MINYLLKWGTYGRALQRAICISHHTTFLPASQQRLIDYSRGQQPWHFSYPIMPQPLGVMAVAVKSCNASWDYNFTKAGVPRLPTTGLEQGYWIKVHWGLLCKIFQQKSKSHVYARTLILHVTVPPSHHSSLLYISVLSPCFTYQSPNPNQSPLHITVYLYISNLSPPFTSQYPPLYITVFFTSQPLPFTSVTSFSSLNQCFQSPLPITSVSSVSSLHHSSPVVSSVPLHIMLKQQQWRSLPGEETQAAKWQGHSLDGTVTWPWLELRSFI